MGIWWPYYRTAVLSLGLGGLPRGVLTGLVITALFSLERVLAQPTMARLRRAPFLVQTREGGSDVRNTQ
jgi:hypothetical protein